MSESRDDLRGTTHALCQALAAAAAAVPGVARLEPTLRGTVHRVRAATEPLAVGRTVRAAADGIRITRRQDVVDVQIDIALDQTRSAEATARAVRDAARACIAQHQLVFGDTRVSVLDLAP